MIVALLLDTVTMVSYGKGPGPTSVKNPGSAPELSKTYQTILLKSDKIIYHEAREAC